MDAAVFVGPLFRYSAERRDAEGVGWGCGKLAAHATALELFLQVAGDCRRVFDRRFEVVRVCADARPGLAEFGSVLDAVEGEGDQVLVGVVNQCIGSRVENEDRERVEE